MNSYEVISSTTGPNSTKTERYRLRSPPIKPLRVLLHRFADTPRGGYGKDMAAVDLHSISEVALMEIKPSQGHLGGFTGAVCHTLIGSIQY